MLLAQSQFYKWREGSRIVLETWLIEAFASNPSFDHLWLTWVRKEVKRVIKATNWIRISSALLGWVTSWFCFSICQMWIKVTHILWLVRSLVSSCRRNRAWPVVRAGLSMWVRDSCEMLCTHGRPCWEYSQMRVPFACWSGAQKCGLWLLFWRSYCHAGPS